MEHPLFYPQISRSWIFPFCWHSACLFFKPIYDGFLPISNLLLTLGSHRSLWGPQKSKNKLTAAPWTQLFQKKDPVSFLLRIHTNKLDVFNNSTYILAMFLGHEGCPAHWFSYIQWKLGNIFEAFISQANVLFNVVNSKERATFTDTQMYTQDFCFLICFMFSGLSLVLNKEGLWLTKTHTHPERTQRRATSQAGLDTHLL